jgi:hypothetical protein
MQPLEVEAISYSIKVKRNNGNTKILLIGGIE